MWKPGRRADVYCGRCGAHNRSVRERLVVLRDLAETRWRAFHRERRRFFVTCRASAGWVRLWFWRRTNSGLTAPFASTHFRVYTCFVAWLMNEWVLKAMFSGIVRFPVYHIMQAGLLGMSIFMMVKAAHDEAFALPIFGELAQRSMSEN